LSSSSLGGYPRMRRYVCSFSLLLLLLLLWRRRRRRRRRTRRCQYREHMVVVRCGRVMDGCDRKSFVSFLCLSPIRNVEEGRRCWCP
jgi:hypothetical protein